MSLPETIRVTSGTQHALPFLLTLSALAVPAATAQSGATRAPSADFVERPGERELSGRLIARPVQYEALRAAGLSHMVARQRVVEARLAMTDYDVVSFVPQTDEYLFHVPSGATESGVASALLASGAFEYVEPDWVLYPIGCPNDPLLGNQWHHDPNIMDSCAGWDLHTGGSSVAVGICDTGVLTSHQDLQLHRLEGYNAVDQQWESAGGNIGPVHPHGTQTTGCAAANGDNGLGVSGVGWNLSHRMLRVSNSSSGSAALSTLQHAARTSIENGDRVASVSYSGVDTASNLTTATYIKSIGGLLVWAAGNDGRNLTFGNRDADDLIVAGATDSNDNKASFSAFGPFVDLTAPGVSVATTHSSSNSSYAAVSGTSFACPLTAGLCALIWSADPTLTPDEVESVLKQGAEDLGSAGVDNTYGYGRIDTLGALGLLGGGSAPGADFSGSPTAGAVPLTVDFSDASTGAPTSWSWSFGDGGTSSAQNPSHTYTAEGTYTVSLTVSNANGADTLTRTDYVTVDPEPDPPPVADFVGAPTSGIVPLGVDFTDLSTNAPTSWSWSFGDGGSSTAQNPSHTYSAAGVYTVSLTASNSGGSDTLTRTGYITVDPDPGTPPVADFVGLPTSGTAPLTVEFTDLSANDPTSWAWDFGDGGSSSARNPSHTYTSAGSYTVSLTVTNAAGSDTLTLPAYVSVDPGGGGPVFADGFESGDFVAGGWVVANSEARVHSKGAFTGSFGAWLRLTTAIEVAVDSSGRSGVSLSYARLVDRFGGGEQLRVEWFDGSSWNLVEATGDTGWATTTVALGPAADDNAALRIRFSTNAGSRRGQASVDDVVVGAD